MTKQRTWKELMALTPGEPPFNDECNCEQSIQLQSQIDEARRLVTLAMDFWSAPGIDMPDIDTFSDMETFLEETGEPYQCKWDENGDYIGEPTKPVGMTVEDHDAREACVALLSDE